MAKLITVSPPPPAATTTLLFFLLLAANTAISAQQQPHRLLQSQTSVPKPRREKLTHLRLFWHDIVSGPSPTAVQVASAAFTNASATSFGLVRVIDNPLTEGPAMASRLVGRAQGFYASVAQEVLGLMMAMNFAFSEGKYNGSTITVLGRNEVFTAVREMPVIGGSGLFRLARGYVQAKTHAFDLKRGNAVVEYNVYVFHY